MREKKKALKRKILLLLFPFQKVYKKDKGAGKVCLVTALHLGKIKNVWGRISKI